MSTGLPCDSAGKKSACDVGDLGLVPGVGRSPRGGKGYPLQYSGLENSMDCCPPGSSLQGILQARALKWVAISFSRGSSQPRDRTHVSCIAGGLLLSEPPGKSPQFSDIIKFPLLGRKLRHTNPQPQASICQSKI